jgi:hypothetical protein
MFFFLFYSFILAFFEKCDLKGRVLGWLCGCTLMGFEKAKRTGVRAVIWKVGCESLVWDGTGFDVL